MSEHRILLIENPARLSIDLGRLKIERANLPDVFVAPKDVAILVLHHTTIELTAHVLRTMAQAGGAIMSTDEKHHPTALSLPLVGNIALPARLRQQIDLEKSEHPRELWRQIVCSRLLGEAANLREFNIKGALRLERMTKEVRPGDTGKLEGQAARHYWAHLFTKQFRRNKQGADDPINSRLNFGYAILRALIAREVVAAGLQPSLGIGHNNLENPYNLADDLMEPYRYVVERHVWADPQREIAFDGAARKAVAGFIQTSLPLAGEEYRLPAAVAYTVASYCRILQQGEGELVLPFFAVRGKRGSQRLAHYVGDRRIRLSDDDERGTP